MTASGVRPAMIVFDEGRIVAIEPWQASGDCFDFKEAYILPGLVDTHVHINQPGRTDWEGFETATRAAAAGGFTCLVDMPLNSIPATINVEALERKRESASGECMVDYAFWGGCVHGNKEDLEPLAQAGVRGFKCFMTPSGVDEFQAVDEADLRLALPIIAASGLPLLVHAEDPAAIMSSEDKVWIKYSDYLRSRPGESEVKAIELLIHLCREFRCPIHIVHLASELPLPMLAEARAQGLPISVETCPHYLYFSAEDVPDGATQFKCAPPVRSAITQQALWEALNQGAIDLIATDHSPCSPALKCRETGDFAKAWGGIASLSLAFSAVNTEARKRNFTMDDLVRLMARKPAELAGLEERKGSIAVGCDADFVVFDEDAQFTVTADKLHFRHAVTPYLGETLSGLVKQTFLRGECVYREGEFMGKSPGRECRV